MLCIKTLTAGTNKINFIKNLIKFFFVLGIVSVLLYYLHTNNLLIPAIAVSSVLYLIVYFSIGTIMVFSAVGEVLGENQIQNNNYLMSIIFYLLFVLILWFTVLLFWPLFSIPDSALSKKKKYQSIESFEEKLIQKYGATAILEIAE